MNRTDDECYTGTGPAADVVGARPAYREDFFGHASRLALELECLLMDTRNDAAQSRWWDSAHEALEQWRQAVREMEQAVEADHHPDSQAVDRFAAAMKEKLARARAKGRSGWQNLPLEELSRMLREHVEKGDPLDVANFCMFLWNLGHGIGAEPAHPAAVHCDNCGCDWLDNGLNPAGCPYCKLRAEVERDTALLQQALEALEALKAENEMLREALKDAEHQKAALTTTADNQGRCDCRQCIRERGDMNFGAPRLMTEFIVCRKCGNKRCPHATDHRNECTDSNDTGQAGSEY